MLFPAPSTRPAGGHEKISSASVAVLAKPCNSPPEQPGQRLVVRVIRGVIGKARGYVPVQNELVVEELFLMVLYSRVLISPLPNPVAFEL